MTVFRHAHEVEQIAKPLIAQHHQDLYGIRVEYVFRDTIQKKSGKEVWGTASKVTGRAALLGTPGAMDSSGQEFFVIEIAEDVWDNITDIQRKALVDHELCHCTTEDDGNGGVKLVLRSHDVEEFGEILDRYGVWSRSIAETLKGSRGAVELFFNNLDVNPGAIPDDPDLGDQP